MKIVSHILCIVCLALLLFGCTGGPRVIPRGKMSKIYAEMLVTDQWINRNPSVMRMADTSLVYEPILEKYGYTSEDYRFSVEHYMDDPERFSRILRTSSEILEARLDELRKLKKELEDAIVVIKTNFKIEEYFPCLLTEPYVHYFDSLTFESDTMGCYRMKSIERSDTTYDGLVMVIRVDSLSVKDSLIVADSLKIQDSTHIKGRLPLRLVDDKLNVPIQLDTAVKLINDDNYFKRISIKKAK